MSCVVVCICVCRCVCVFKQWLCDGFRLALLTCCSHQRHAQVRAIRSTVNHPSRRARGAGRWSIVTRPCANRGPRSDRARASVDEWAVRTSTVPPCRRHPAHAGRNRYRSRYRRVVRERDRPHTWRWTGQTEGEACQQSVIDTTHAVVCR